MATPNPSAISKKLKTTLVIGGIGGFLILLNVVAVMLLRTEHKLRQDEAKTRNIDSISAGK